MKNVVKPLQFLYFLLKVHGLIPFKFDFDKRKAFHTTTSLRYSIVFSIIFWIYLTYYIFDICSLINRIEKDLLMMYMLTIDMVTAFFKTLCVYIIQLVNSRKIIASINSLMTLCEEIFGQDLTVRSCFADSKLRNYCKRKVLSVSVQVISLTIGFVTSEYNLSLYYAIQNTIFILWVNVITTIVNSVFYCGSMLFSVRFYQILDRRIKMLSESNGGGTIEEISFLYEQITTFTSKVSDIYVLEIVLSLIGIIIWGTASVSRATMLFFDSILYVILCSCSTCT